MIPILFDTNETQFDNNGICRLRDCISCVVTEERNGVYECDFEYPVDGANFDTIKPGMIIGVTHSEAKRDRAIIVPGELTDEEGVLITDENGNPFEVSANTRVVPEYDIQPFDIVSFTRPIDGVVTFHCVHISYRQSYLTVVGSGINSLWDAFVLLQTAEPGNPFTYSADNYPEGYLACADGLPHTVKSMLGGMEGSILDVFGGEYEWNRFSVILHTERGIHRPFTIRYGVNMLDYEEEYDISETYSSCIPYWTDGTNIVVGSRQTCGASTVTGRGECVPLDVSDRFEDREAEEEGEDPPLPTAGEVEEMGITVMAAQNPTVPNKSIKVEFVRLQDMGYEDLAELYECGLCDTIKVEFPYLGATGEYKIVKTVWDVLMDRYESMELGSLSTTLAEALGI